MAEQRIDVTVDGRDFCVIRGGRRWTKVPEYMSNRQLTARWFVDEATGEVRPARSWKAPMDYQHGGEAKRFVLGIIEQAHAAVS